MADMTTLAAREAGIAITDDGIRVTVTKGSARFRFRLAWLTPDLVRGVKAGVISRDMAEIISNAYGIDPPDYRRFVAERLPSGKAWLVRDTEGSALRYNGRPTSVIGWEGMTEKAARQVADRYESGWRPVD